MNRENIQKVRDAIAALQPGRYDQSMWSIGCDKPEDLAHTCGTSGCIAGWTIAVCRTGAARRYDDNLYSGRAARALGLNDIQAGRLFSACPTGDLDGPTQSDAVRVLDYLLETGEVDWEAPSPSSDRGGS